MRIDGAITIAATATALPAARSSLTQAVEEGIVDGDGRASLADVPCGSGVDVTTMALDAAATALDNAGLTPQDLDLLTYAWVYDQGENNLSPAHRIARLLDVGDCVSIGIQQACNGGAAGVENTVARMLLEPNLRTALVVTADNFAQAGPSRWLQRDIAVLGDGAAATVLGRTPARLSLLSLATSGNSTKNLLSPEDALRFNTDGTMSHMFSLSEDYLTNVEHSIEAISRSIERAVARALFDADLKQADPSIQTLLLPKLGDVFTQLFVLNALPPELQDKSVVLQPQTGHLGAGDLLLNLDHLATTQTLEPGEHALILNIGFGFTTTCLVVKAT